MVSGLGTTPTITYTPDLDYYGSDSFDVQVTDQGFESATITVNVTVNPINDAPVNTVAPAVSGTHHVGQMLTTSDGTWNDDKDNPSPGTISYAYQWQRADDAGGTGMIPVGAASSYTLQATDDGKYIRVRVTATDNGNPGAESTEAFSSPYTLVANAAPVITQGASTPVTMDEDGSPTAFALTLNATDADGDTLTWSISSAAGNGVAGASGTGGSKTITYTPAADWNGSDSFDVQVDDGLLGGTDTITVNVTVDPQTDANDDNPAAGNEDTAQNIAVLGNDTFTSTHSVTATGVAANGSVAIEADNTVTYTPDPDYYGPDSFSYTVSNGGPDETAIVTVAVTAVPDVVNDTLNTNEDTAGTVDVLANDNFEGTPGVISVTQGTNGSVSNLGGGNVQYTPDADYNGPDSFTYTVLSSGVTEIGTVTVTVAADNDMPVFTKGADESINEDDAAQTVVGWATGIDDSDPEVTQTLTFNVSNDNNALFAVQPDIAANGDLTYTPAADANGSALVTVTLTDDDTADDDPAPTALTTAAQTFNITIAAYNDAPVVGAPAGSGTAVEDTPLDVHGAGFTVSDVDEAGLGATMQLAVGEGTIAVTVGTTGVTIDSGNGTGTVNLSGTIAQLNDLLTNGGGGGTIFYSAVQFPSASTTFTVTVNDTGNVGTDPGLTGTGTSEEGSNSATINITSMNDAPVVGAPGGNLAATEDTPLDVHGTGFTVSDVDENNAGAVAGLTVGEGTITVSAGDSGVTVAGGNGTGNVTLNGTIAQLDNLLTGGGTGTIQYSAVQFPSANTLFTVTVNDSGNTGNDPGLTGGPTNEEGTNNVTIDITSRNDAPVVGAPGGPLAATEDILLTIQGTGFTVSDVDENNAGADATLDVVEGTITVTAGNSGVTITGGNGTGTVTLSGTIAQLNNLLTGGSTGTIQYSTVQFPAANTTFTVTVNDKGNTGTDPGLTGDGTSEEGTNNVTINITSINDAPVLTAPAVLNAIEDTPMDIHGTGFTVSDVDENDDGAIATLTVVEGAISVAIGTAVVNIDSGNGTDTVQLSGTIAELNNLFTSGGPAVGSITYSAVQYPSATTTLTVTVNDTGNNGNDPGLTGGVADEEATQVVTINISSLNDAPDVTAPGAALNATEDILLNIHGTGFSVSDVDSEPLSFMVMTLSVPEGIIRVFGGTSGVSSFLGNNTGTVTLTGSITQLNNLLTGASTGTIHYEADQYPSANTTFTVTVNDNGASGLDPGLTGGPSDEEGNNSVTINITGKNDAPIITVPGAQAVNEDTDLPIAGISIADVDVGPSNMLVTLSVTDGTITLNTIPVLLSFSVGDGTADANMTFTGTLADINTALSSLEYRGNPHYNGADTLSLFVDDLGNTGTPPPGSLTDSESIPITVNAVNDQPTVATLPMTVTYPEDPAAAVDIDPALVVGDADTIDVGGESLTIALTLSGPGAGVLSSVGGGSFDAPTGVWTMTGTVAAINAALDDLQFTPAANFDLDAFISVYVVDGGEDGTSPATGVIQLDVTPVNDYVVTIGDAVADVDEGNDIYFPITITPPIPSGSPNTVTVNYRTVEGTATDNTPPLASSDYADTDTTLTFTQALSATQNIPITTLNEALDDGDKNFTVELYNISDAGILGNNPAVIGTPDTGTGNILDNEYEVNVTAGSNGSITYAGTGQIAERGSDFPPADVFTVTADPGYCIADLTRNGVSVLGGTVPDSPYGPGSTDLTPYQATNIQDDPTDIVATFRDEIQLTGLIEPASIRTAPYDFGRWAFKDNTSNHYLIGEGRGGGTEAEVTPGVVPANAWNTHGDYVVLSCDQSSVTIYYKEVEGWYKPVNHGRTWTISPGATTSQSESGTYDSKTVKLTTSVSGGNGDETISVDPAGTGEGGAGTHTYLLDDAETVTLSAHGSTSPATIFLRWVGPVADEFDANTTVSMTSDRTVSAVFGTPGADNDGDGYDESVDCDDTDPTVHPDAQEICGDGIDQNCTGGDPVCTGNDADDDGDGYTENQGDCNDSNAAIHPGAQEICGNDVDEDCYDGARDCGTEVICSDYAERPLETQALSAPPNVLFVLDDSGSMRWETMTDESDGLFGGDRYMYGSSGLSSSERREWLSQYSTYQKMYYNPNVDYAPWPRWNKMDDTEGTNGTKIKNGGPEPAFDADKDSPRNDPIDDGSTRNMNDTWFSVFPATVPQYITLTRDGDGGDYGNSTLADAVKLEGVNYAGDVDTHASPSPITGDVKDYNLIMDNEPDEPEQTFTELSGDWSNTSPNVKWDGQALYSDDINAQAAWYFSITQPGDYKVYAWVNSYDSRDTEARYTIYYNGGSRDVLMDQAQFGSQWYQLVNPLTGDGSFPFVAQTNTSPSAVTVVNSHYFIWHDNDGDGTMEYKASQFADSLNSEVYLVNVTGTGGTYTMDFYRFVDSNNNDTINDGELFLLTAADTYWNDIQPRNEGGTLRTAEEERQNFANWYSFYRRREYTAKAAIGRVIAGTEGMNIGILGINGQIEKELVPIGVEATLVKTIDNKDAGFDDRGDNWRESSASNEYAGSSYYEDDVGDVARWTPTFAASEAGVYTVYAWWGCHSNRDTNAKYTVVDKNGSTDYFKNQRSGQTTSACGQWVTLGNHDFDETGSQYVEVSRHAGSDGGSTSADAVRFVHTGARVLVNKSDELLNELYQVYSSGWTPLRRGLQNAGEYFDNEDGGASGGLSSTAPWDTEADGGGCQRAFSILMTDGFYNGSDPSPSVGNEDSDGNRPRGTSKDALGDGSFDGGVFTGLGSNTLADVAMYYYEKDLHEGLANNVAAHDHDIATHQHMVTYGVAFGVKGTINPDSYPNCLPDSPPSETTAVCPTWPQPSGSNAPTLIDDLYHASINGRGKYLDASNPAELVKALEDIIADVSDTTGTGSSVSINAQELKEGTLLFQASYLTGSWRGDLKAKQLNATTGEIESELWSAAEQLHGVTAANRKIITWDGITGQRFRYDASNPAELSIDQAEKLLDLASGTITGTDLSALDTSDYNSNGTVDKTDLQKLVEYLRGDDANEGSGTGQFRARARKEGETDIGVLGDIVHSAPLHVGNAVYVGGNDGMLHAFDSDTGDEVFAYVPNLIYDDLDDLADQAYSHNYYVDNSPFASVIKDSADPPVSTTLLVGSLGRGGKGVFALDITSVSDTFPANEIEAQQIAKWEYPVTPGSDDDMGFTFGRAFVVNSNLGYVVIFGNGYQSTNGKAVLYVLNAHSGALLGKIDTGVGSPTLCNGLSTPVLIDPDADGKVDYVYAGDLLGNMWKFDLTGTTIGTATPATDWKVAYNTVSDHSGTVMPLFQAKNKQGHRQPITTKPDVMRHPDTGKGGYMVIFGTGRYLGNADFGENSVQTIYGIWDWEDAWSGGPAPDKYLGSFGPVDTGAPEFGLLSYDNKPVGDSFFPDDTVTTTVTGSSSGATATIEGVEVVSDTAGVLKLVDISGTFQDGEFLLGGDVSSDATVSGTMQTVTFRPLSNLEATAGTATAQYVTLLEQNQIAFLNEQRFMSDNSIDFFDPDSSAATNTGAFQHVGWYFDLPGSNEKMIRDPLIRNGVAFVISSIPSSSPCASGGSSIIHALDAASGGRTLFAVFDISGPDGVPDGEIDEHDLVNIGSPDNPHYVAPTGLKKDAMWYTPAVLPVAEQDADIMYFSTSEGDVKLERVEAEKVGMFYWRELF